MVVGSTLDLAKTLHAQEKRLLITAVSSMSDDRSDYDELYFEQDYEKVVKYIEYYEQTETENQNGCIIGSKNTSLTRSPLSTTNPQVNEEQNNANHQESVEIGKNGRATQKTREQSCRYQNKQPVKFASVHRSDLGGSRFSD